MSAPVCYVFLIPGFLLWMFFFFPFFFFPQRFLLRQNQQGGKQANALRPIVKFHGTEEAGRTFSASPPRQKQQQQNSILYSDFSELEWGKQKFHKWCNLVIEVQHFKKSKSIWWRRRYVREWMTMEQLGCCLESSLSHLCAHFSCFIPSFHQCYCCPTSTTTTSTTPPPPPLHHYHCLHPHYLPHSNSFQSHGSHHHYQPQLSNILCSLPALPSEEKISLILQLESRWGLIMCSLYNRVAEVSFLFFVFCFFWTCVSGSDSPFFSGQAFRTKTSQEKRMFGAWYLCSAFPAPVGTVRGTTQLCPGFLSIGFQTEIRSV